MTIKIKREWVMVVALTLLIVFVFVGWIIPYNRDGFQQYSNKFYTSWVQTDTLLRDGKFAQAEYSLENMENDSYNMEKHRNDFFQNHGVDSIYLSMTQLHEDAESAIQIVESNLDNDKYTPQKNFRWQWRVDEYGYSLALHDGP